MLTILNDTHIGTKRAAGTTPESQGQLRNWCIQNLRAEFNNNDGQDILILGDLFDSFSVNLSDVVEVFHLFVDYCYYHSDATIYVAAGNHDLSKTSSTMSSFLALRGLLKHNKQVQFITEPTAIKYGYVIPHLVNQEAFDKALAEVPPTEYLFLHCNYDNGFAAQSDHSLNLSADVAETLPVSYIIMGHEHTTRELGKVVIPGVQWPTSISDCLHREGVFYKTQLTKQGPQLVLTSVIDEKAVYSEVKVFDEASVNPDDLFIRVVGKVPQDRLQDVIKWINDLRRKHSAFVITNAVQFEADGSIFSLENLGTEVKAFDVVSALRETLTTIEQQILDSVC